MKVIAINEECHGQIAIVSDYRHAIMWLVNDNWLTDGTEVKGNKSYLDWEPIKDYLGEDWIDYITERWDIEEFNIFFDGTFRLEEIEVYGTDNKQEEKEEEEHYYQFSGTWYCGCWAKTKEEAIDWFKHDMDFSYEISLDDDYTITEEDSEGNNA